MVPPPLRLRLDGAALVANWRALDRLSGTARAGAAVKADGYGLGAREVASRLAAAGCRDFFVSNWNEAAALADVGLSIAVLHGVREEDMPATALPGVRPVLNTRAQVARWRQAGGGVCDVMVDTGMNRLGISASDIADGLLDGLEIDVLMSHLACADENSAMNDAQRARFAGLAGTTAAQRMSLANSAGTVLGGGYHFDLTRPGLALYGGIPRGELADVIQPVVVPEAQVLQRRTVAAGEVVGYNATWQAPRPTEVAIVNLGYADGYWRGFSNAGSVRVKDVALPVIGRVSMDLTAIDVSAMPELGEGDWLPFAFDLPTAASTSGISQYELLTGLGRRYGRSWDA